MKDLAPEIIRQRVLIEGLYTADINREKVEEYLLGLAAHLDLRVYGKPIIHAPEGIGKDENEGFDAFIPLIDSGISLYVWSATRFFAVVIFTCKAFSQEDAIEFTRDFFAATEIEFKAF